MKKRNLIFATDIGGTGNTGIVDLNTMMCLCVCPEEQANEIISWYENATVKEKLICIDGVTTNYTITDTGRIFSFNRGVKKEVSPQYIKDGYKIFGMYINGERVYKLVSVLVANAFVDNPNNKPQVNHKNGVKDDNRADNLEWVTASENVKHAWDTGLRKSNKNKPLKEDQVREVRKMLEIGDSNTDIARRFSVSHHVISKIRKNKNYKGIGLI